MHSNKILPILGGIILAMVIFIGLKALNSNDPELVEMGSPPEPGSPDADSPADTIRTLNASVAEVQRENTKLQQQNNVLITQNEDLLRQQESISAHVKKELTEELIDKQKDSENRMFSGLSEKIKIFETQLNELSQFQNNAAAGATDIPVGLGLPGAGFSSTGLTITNGIVWVEPLGGGSNQTVTEEYLEQSQPEEQKDILQDDIITNLHDATGNYLKTSLDKPTKDRPAYTIARNSTLTRSTAMTALIGRVPINGSVEEPYPFKVIVGNDNLVANGIKIPGIRHMIFAGTTTGDWGISCVRGKFYSATYVFNDGTIRTLSSDDDSLKKLSDTGASSADNRPLGTISDRFGNPCLPGERINNARDILWGRLMASALSNAGQTLSEQETTQAFSPFSGTASSIVTGDKLKHTGYNMLSGGADELAEYLAESASQYFDAIYVRPGTQLDIHIDVEMPIDYEYNGRKTTYVYDEQFYSSDID